MKHAVASRHMTVTGGAACALWLVDWLMNLGGEPLIGSSRWYVEQAVATGALTCTALFALGVSLSGVAGSGRFGRAILVTWALGRAVLAVGGVVFIAAGKEDVVAAGILFALGGTISSLAGLIGAVVIIRCKVLEGWRRWALLAYTAVGAASPAVLSGERTVVSVAAEMLQYVLLFLVVVAMARVSQQTSETGANPIRVRST